jgi:hypothetical protein
MKSEEFSRIFGKRSKFRSGAMGVVTIRCPNTGQDISTGIDTDQASFDRLPDVRIRGVPFAGLNIRGGNASRTWSS